MNQDVRIYRWQLFNVKRKKYPCSLHVEEIRVFLNIYVHVSTPRIYAYMQFLLTCLCAKIRLFICTTIKWCYWEMQNFFQVFSIALSSCKLWCVKWLNGISFWCQSVNNYLTIAISEVNYLTAGITADTRLSLRDKQNLTLVWTTMPEMSEMPVMNLFVCASLCFNKTTIKSYYKFWHPCFTHFFNQFVFYQTFFIF